jgi:hypothetical protein
MLLVAAVVGELDDELCWRMLFGIPVLVVGIGAGSLTFRSSSAAAPDA